MSKIDDYLPNVSLASGDIIKYNGANYLNEPDTLVNKEDTDINNTLALQTGHIL
jgi:hypothetical protein